MSIRPKSLSTFVAALGCAALLAGCGGSEEGTATPAGGAVPSAAGDASAVPEDEADASVPAESSGDVDYTALTLGEGEFPAPYEIDPALADLDPAELAELGGSVVEGAKITPPECADLQAGAQSADPELLAQTGIALAVDPSTGSSLVETVSPVLQELDVVRAGAASCSSYTVAIPGLGEPVMTTSTVTDVDVAGADDAVLLEIVVAISGQEVPSTIVIATVGGAQVSVTGGAAPGGGGADAAVVQQTAAAGVAKVAAG